MRHYADDRLLWLLVACGLLGAYYAIPKTLQQMSTLTKTACPPPVKPPKKPRPNEDSLPLSTLHTLATGPSEEIRNSAIKIIGRRFLRSPAVKLLLEDLRDPRSNGNQRSDRAIDALWFLYSNRNLRSEVSGSFLDIASLESIVEALVRMLPLHFNAEWNEANQSSDRPLPASPIRPPFRPEAEKKLLLILHKIHKMSDEPAEDLNKGSLRAGLITRWLANYPFPCSMYPWGNYGRKDVTTLFLSNPKDWVSDDPEMAAIFQDIQTSSKALDELVAAGLDYPRATPDSTADWARPPSDWVRDHNADYSNWTQSAPIRRRDTNSDNDSDVHMHDGEETAGHARGPEPDWANLPESWEIQGPLTRRGVPERSREEEAMRRRHREAVVVADSIPSLREGNVVQLIQSEQLRPVIESNTVANASVALMDEEDLRWLADVDTRTQVEPDSRRVGLDIRGTDIVALAQEATVRVNDELERNRVAFAALAPDDLEGNVRMLESVQEQLQELRVLEQRVNGLRALEPEL